MMCTVYSCFYSSVASPILHSFPTRRSSDLRFHLALLPDIQLTTSWADTIFYSGWRSVAVSPKERAHPKYDAGQARSEEHTSELQSRQYLVCRLLLEKKKNYNKDERTWSRRR